MATAQQVLGPTELEADDAWDARFRIRTAAADANGERRGDPEQRGTTAHHVKSTQGVTECHVARPSEPTFDS
jgi:hypothetical protein